MNPIIMTGMHRSGTSAVARLSQALGVNVGSDLLGAAGGNVYGHFEEAVFIHFHDALIARLFPHCAPFCEWLPLADSEITYNAADRAEAESIWRRHRAAGGQAWKDPRASLFLDLWTDILPDAKVIICLRHPYQVHRSLLRRGEPFLHVDYSASIAGWTVYNQRILKVLSRLPRDRFLLVDADSSLREPHRLAQGLASFHGVPFSQAAVDAIAPEAFHFEDGADEALDHFDSYFPDADWVYRQLKQFDFLHPITVPTGSEKVPTPSRSPEIRLLEFEEANGLRAKAKKMLIRSIMVDRQRLTDLYKQLSAVDAEKDSLIEDLSLLNDRLKRRLVEMHGAQH
jgi:hypothetical protein